MSQETGKNIYLENPIHININHLKPECGKCFGLCCVALYFSKEDGFPTNKKAGSRCPNLKPDFHCAVHNKLGTLGLKGCIAYECFGAGQKVSKVTFGGQDWRKNPASADLMFDVFLVMRQLHEITWYLTESLSLTQTAPIKEDIREAIYETQQITQSTPHVLMEFNLSGHRAKINVLLKQASKLVRSELSCGNKVISNVDKKRKMPAN